jgi:seryl-tRNA synthetase
MTDFTSTSVRTGGFNFGVNMDFEKMKKLQDELNKLLEERPELQALQDKIDATLNKAGSKNNRLTMIQNLMLDSFFELNEKLQEMSGKMKKLGSDVKEIGKPTKSKLRVVPNLTVLKDE